MLGSKQDQIGCMGTGGVAGVCVCVGEGGGGGGQPPPLIRMTFKKNFLASLNLKVKIILSCV